MDIVPVRSWRQEFRFWRVQIIDLIRCIGYAVRYFNKNSWLSVLGKMEGILKYSNYWNLMASPTEALAKVGDD